MNEAEGCRGRPAWYALGFLAALAACADPTLTPIVAGKMAPGHWGGQDAGVVGPRPTSTSMSAALSATSPGMSRSTRTGASR
jgi:hypothetical protein